MWRYRQNERFIYLFPNVNIGCHFDSLRTWRYCEIKVLAGGGAAIPKKEWGRGVWYFSRLRRSWRLRRQISLYYITTAPPPNVTRLLHNTASYAGYHFESAPFMLLLHKEFEFHLKVRCTAWQEAWNSISSHCVTLRDKVMWHYGCWLCKNVITRKLWFLSSFEFVFVWVCVK